MSKRRKSSNKRAIQAKSGDFISSALSPGVLAGVALIAVAAFLIYYPSISGGFIWDDYDLLTEAPLIKASDGLYRFWFTIEPTDYWPVTNSTFWIEWRLWGMNSTGYHVTNIILHIAESLLIWTILRKLSIPGAFLAALIFAVHPVNVESVAWIAQRKNLMAMLFFLLSILFYLKEEISSPSPQNGLPGCHAHACRGHVRQSIASRWYWLSLAAFVLAMLGKGSVAVLPVLLLGIIWWLRPLTIWDLLRSAPFFIVSMMLVGVNVWFQTHGTGTVIRTASIAERLLGAGAVVWFYLYKSLLPFYLAFVYPLWHIRTGNLLWWLPLLAALAITAVLWQYRKSWSRPFLFAWGFFCVALVPVVGLTDVYFMKYSLVADHYQHIALIAIIALAAASWSLWHQRAQWSSRTASNIVAGVVVGTFMLLSWRQSGLYRDEFTLFQDTVNKNPDCWMAHNNLGLAFSKKDQFPAAIEQYKQALRLNPDLYEAYNNLGNALLKTGRPREAIDHYKQALRLKSDYAEAYNNLGGALVQTDRPREAIEHYQQAIRFKPGYPEAFSNLGVAMAQIGRSEEAIKQYKQALALKPDYTEAYINMGVLLVKMDRSQEAIDCYKQVLRFKSDHSLAHYNLGLIFAKLGRLPEAIKHYEQALRLKSDYFEAYFNVALLYAQTNRSSDAIAAAQKALEIARSNGQTPQAKKIEDWLNSYRTNSNRPPERGK